MTRARLMLREPRPSSKAVLVQLGVGCIGAILCFAIGLASAVVHWRDSDIGVAGGGDGAEALMGLCLLSATGSALVGAMLGLLTGCWVASLSLFDRETADN